MGKDSEILVDTDILIKVFRGHAGHKAALDKEDGKLAISTVTYLELLFRLKTRRRIIDLNKQVKAYKVVHISDAISAKAIEIVNKYAVQHSLKPADALIAATSIVNNLLLYTDNKEDFKFIKEIKFYK